MTVLRTQLAGVARRPARLLLTGLAVLVVSFVVYATVLARASTERSVLDGLSGTPAAVDLVAADGALTTAQLSAIAALPGVAEATGRADLGVDVGGQYLGVIADPGTGPLSTVRLTQGRYPSATGEIAVTARTADRLALPIGKTIRVTTGWSDDGKPTGPKNVTVVGTVAGADDFGGTAYAPQPIVSALTGVDLLGRIEIRLASGVSADQVRSAVEAVLAAAPAPAEGEQRPQVRTGAEVRAEEADRAVDDIGELFAAVGMFVAIAVVAAGLVAASTFRIVFAQRLRQLALLRAVGAGRGAITRALAAEGALIGLVTGVTGVLGALGLGHLLPVVARLFDVRIAGPGVPVLPALGVVALAVLITVVAVLAPAASAARVSPLEALRSASTTGARRDIGVLRWVTGLLLVAGSAALAAWVVRGLPGREPVDYDPQPMLLGVVASGALAFLALIALGPVLVRPLLAGLGWPVRRLGAVGRLAVGGVGGAPRRAAAVSVVVALGVALIAGVLVGGASMRALADRETAASVPADFELRVSGDGGIPAATVDQLRGRTELAHVTPYRKLTGIRIEGTSAPDLTLDANDLAVTTLPTAAQLYVSSGSLTAVGPGRMAISGFTTDITGLRLGDQATVTAGKKKVRLTVAAVLPDSAPLGAGLLLDPADLTALGAPAAYSGVLADASGTAEAARTAGQQALQQTAAGRSDLTLEVLADQRDQIDRLLTIVLAIAVGLISLTVLIAVVGVGTTTALSVVERSRESGLLRAVGLSRGGLRTMLTTESGLYGVIGAAFGLLLGVPYAWLAVRALGVNAPLRLPAGQLVIVFAVLVLFTALAGVLPARRAARVSPVVALGSD